jgi:hypothetical protein
MFDEGNTVGTWKPKDEEDQKHGTGSVDVSIDGYAKQECSRDLVWYAKWQRVLPHVGG